VVHRLRSPAVSRKFFGTDGVRGVVGETLTADLVERVARAATLWAGGGDVLIARDTRGSGPELELAAARGAASADARVRVAGVLPTPAVPLLAGGALGIVVSASHNPPEYNGVKLFDRRGQKLSDADEEAIEALLDEPGRGGGSVSTVDDAPERYTRYVLDHFGADLSGLRLAVDCANGAYSAIAPAVFERLGARVTAIAAEPNGTNINVGCGAMDLSLLRAAVGGGAFDLGVAFDGDGDRVLAVDASGAVVDGDAIVAILALHLGVDAVAVTAMTNHGFHRLMAEHGVRVVTTDVGDRYVLEALYADGAVLGGEQSGHIVYLKHHVTGDGLVGALLLCRALGGRSLADAAAALERVPQAKENVPVRRKEVPESILAEVERVNGELAPAGRVLVRPSGTEPLVRILVEAEPLAFAREVCDRIAALVRRELG
jgi:phosphoglucosamine mutase